MKELILAVFLIVSFSAFALYASAEDDLQPTETESEYDCENHIGF